MSVALEPQQEPRTQPTVIDAARRSMVHRQHALLWQPLLIEIARSLDRTTAAAAAVATLSRLLPEHTIRFGWGVVRKGRDGDGKPVAATAKLQRLIDSRLGWLGVENSVYQSLKAQFAKLGTPQDATRDPQSPTDSTTTDSTTANSSPVLPSTAGLVRWESANLVLELPAETDHHAMIWIRPPQGRQEELRALAHMVTPETLATIATVFFSRPASNRMGKVLTLLGKGWSARTSIGIGMMILTLLACIPVQYRIDATATVTAMNARRVAAPISATLATAHVRPGDRVSQGDPLLELDGRPLRIELEALTSDIEATTKEEDISLAGGEIAQAQLAKLRRISLSKRRDLIVDQLDQLVITSPIDGIVIQGDLHHSLGTPLELGATLLEIAPSDCVEVELEIPEVEIGFVEPEGEVELWFPAVGRRTWQTRIAEVWPAATIRDDQNVFIAKTPMPQFRQTEADPGESVEPPAASESPRVGMKGEAVIFGPKRPWIWKWVRLPIRRLGWLMGW